MLTVEQRFLSKVKKTDNCWLWTGSKQHNGYGRMHLIIDGKRTMQQAHRIAWSIHHRLPILDGLWVLHRCDNPPCVNPEHLFLGTRSDNMQDASRKGRIPRRAGKSRQTHCIRGHAFTPENTYRRPSGHRTCRACRKEKETTTEFRVRRRALRWGEPRARIGKEGE